MELVSPRTASTGHATTPAPPRRTAAPREPQPVHTTPTASREVQRSPKRSRSVSRVPSRLDIGLVEALVQERRYRPVRRQEVSEFLPTDDVLVPLVPELGGEPSLAVIVKPFPDRSAKRVELILNELGGRRPLRLYVREQTGCIAERELRLPGAGDLVVPRPPE